jgi:hypothetical protein
VVKSVPDLFRGFGEGIPVFSLPFQEVIGEELKDCSNCLGLTVGVVLPTDEDDLPVLMRDCLVYLLGVTRVHKFIVLGCEYDGGAAYIFDIP